MTDFSKHFDGVSCLVTGGAGFIGSHLVDGLLAAGAKVKVLDDLSTGSLDNLAHLKGTSHGHHAQLIVGDICDYKMCVEAAEGCRYVFHQAALGSVPYSLERPEHCIAVNVGGTANVFAAARQVGADRVVYASSSAVYGDSTGLPKREGEEGRSLSPYATSKWMNEELADTYSRCLEGDTSFVGLRYFNIYGPRQSPKGPYAAVIPLFFAAGKAKQAMRIFGDGEQSRDFAFVGDCVQANMRAAIAPKASAGRAYNIGARGVTTINELARIITELTKSPQEPVHEAERAGDIKLSHADISAAEQGLNYDPTITLSEGLALTHQA